MAYQEEKEKAELLQQLRKVVRQQINGEMDWVRARAFWESKLPTIEPTLLAEALSYALQNALIIELKQSIRCSL